MMRILPRFAFAAALGAAVPALAQTPVPFTVSGDTASAVVQLPGGLAADLSLTFEDVVGLNTGSLAISAEVLAPAGQPLAGRLPAAVHVPTAFPVLIRIEPTATSALSFSGVYAITLHTHNLTLQMQPPLGLFKATAGGPFQEITRWAGVGSYRVAGSSGGFSEFLIAVEPRPMNVVVAAKFDALESALATHGPEMPAAIAQDLETRLAQARQLYTAAAYPAALNALEGFGAAVRAASGTAIPDVWRANDTLVNVAGLLRAGAETLAYSIQLKANGVH
jgi:hypothetical protein